MWVVRYKAENIEGKRISGVYSIKEFYAYVKILRTEGYFITDVTKMLSFEILNSGRKISYYEISIFSSQFSEILSSGINMDKALSILIGTATNKRIKKSLFQIKMEVEAGNKLKDSFEKFQNIYPKFMINMMGIGEESGNLDVILKKISEFYKKEWTLKKKIWSAMAYPVMVIVFTAITLFIIINNVIPKIVDVIISLGGTIPTITKIMIKINSLVLSKAFVFIFITIVLILVFLKNKNKGMLKFIVTKVPVIKQIYLEISISRISETLSMLLSSGINLINSLELLMQSFEDVRLKKEIYKCIKEINNGNSFLYSINNTELKNIIFCSMIYVGESTGKLDIMLLRASEIINENNDRKIKKLLNFIGPALLILVTLLVGTIIISIIIPMLNVMDSIK